MAIKVIVGETSHLLICDLRKSLGREAKRSTPQPSDRFDVFAPRIVIYAAAIAARDDQWAFLLVFAQIGLHVYEARNIARLDRVLEYRSRFILGCSSFEQIVRLCNTVIACCCRCADIAIEQVTTD